MGSSSSKENLNFPWNALVGSAASMPEKRRVQLQATLGRVMRDLHSFLPPKESSSATERDEEVTARLSEFMKGGACKESFTGLLDCIKENNDGSSSSVCHKYVPKLIDCIDAHSDYYQPIISLVEYTWEQIEKDLEQHADLFW